MKYSFFKSLFFQAILYILFPVLSLLLLFEYHYYSQQIDALNLRVEQEQKSTKNLISHQLALMDKQVDLLETKLSTDLEKRLNFLYNLGPTFEKQLAEGNLDRILDSLKIDPKIYEFYYVNEKLKVINSNLVEDEGYVLAASGTKDSKVFIKLMREKGYISDRSAYSDVTGLARKYAYLGAPSKKGIYELSLEPTFESAFMRENFKMLNDLSNSKRIKKINLYYGTNRCKNAFNNELVPKKHQKAFMKMLNGQKKAIFFERINDQNSTTEYCFFPMKNANFIKGWVVSFETTTELRDLILKQAKQNFLIHAICISCLVFFLLLIGVTRISKPINMMISSLRKLQNGDFSQKVVYNGFSELNELSNHFNESIRYVENDHRDLEDRVSARTKELFDITEELREAKLRQGLLLKDTNHRTKNNLQIILSILRIKRSKSVDKIVQSTIEEIENRLISIAKIQDTFFQGTEAGHVNLPEFLTDYVNTIDQGLGNEHITVKLLVEQMIIDLNSFACLGLLINELMTNSFKYAFEKDKKGEISIHVLKEIGSQKAKLLYQDNGKGFNEGDIKLDSIGHLLIDGFANQLDGKLIKEKTNGTSYTMVFSLNH